MELENAFCEYFSHDDDWTEEEFEAAWSALVVAGIALYFEEKTCPWQRRELQLKQYVETVLHAETAPVAVPAALVRLFVERLARSLQAI